jgi:predicted  nucleic acid-binding Zn-ribbon protein
VREEQVRGEAIAILPMDVNATLVYAKSGPIPKDVRDALTKAAGLKGDLVDTQRQLQDRQQRIAQISQEQQRLRENMKTVDSKTEYYNRLLKKLDEQETQIEGLQKEVDSLTKQQEQQRKALEDYLGNLSVG